MGRLIDLHIHTTASDGIYPPTEVVKKAKEIGLAAIGITDHDTVEGIKEAVIAGKELDVEIVPGVEITTYWKEQNKREFHLLGYYFDLEDPRINTTLNYYQKVREKRAGAIVEKLQELGFAITYQKVRETAKGTIGRPHIARAVLENKENERVLTKIFGVMPNIGEFIEAYIIPGKPAYIEKAGMEPLETINLIHKCKGLTVLAHPGWDKKSDQTGGLGLINWGIEIPYQLLAQLKKKAGVD